MDGVQEMVDGALVCAAAVVLPGSATAEQSEFYVDPDTNAARWVAANPGDSRAADISNSADGISTNVSNYRTTAAEVTFAKAVLASIGDGRLRAVVDTSRNGNGPLGSEWCDPPGRAVGTPSTTATGDGLIAAFLWVKLPGEADGCIAPAGSHNGSC